MALMFLKISTNQTKMGGTAKKLVTRSLLGKRFVAEAMLETYTLDGRKDAITGDINLQFSLRHLMSESTDYKDVETALQYLLMSQLGVRVQLTTKFHAELANKGVEYSCARHAKSHYYR